MQIETDTCTPDELAALVRYLYELQEGSLTTQTLAGMAAVAIHQFLDGGLQEQHRARIEDLFSRLNTSFRLDDLMGSEPSEDRARLSQQAFADRLHQIQGAYWGGDVDGWKRAVLQCLASTTPEQEADLMEIFMGNEQVTIKIPPKGCLQ